MLGEMENYDEFRTFKKMIGIQLNSKSNLHIKWDFTGNVLPKVFKRHLIVCLTHENNQNQLAENYMQEIYKSFKSGDLFCYLNPSIGLLEWTEKTSISSVPVLAPYRPSIETNKAKMLRNLKIILAKIVNKSDPVLVSIIIDPRIAYQEISQIAEESRNRMNLTCPFLIMSSRFDSNKVEFERGITSLRLTEIQFDEVTSYYKYFSRHLGLKYAELVIKSLDNDVALSSDKWQCLNFSTYRHKFYYPLCTTFSDIIETMPLTYGSSKSSWKFKLKLKYIQISGNQYNCEQILDLTINEEPSRVFTCRILDPMIQPYTFQKITFESNPFENFAVLTRGIPKI